MNHIFDKSKTSAMNLNSGKSQKAQAGLYLGGQNNALLLPHAPGASMSNNKYSQLNYGPQQQKNKDRYI
jgi:hypothetical protein